MKIKYSNKKNNFRKDFYPIKSLDKTQNKILGYDLEVFGLGIVYGAAMGISCIIDSDYILASAAACFSTLSTVCLLYFSKKTLEVTYLEDLLEK